MEVGGSSYTVHKVLDPAPAGVFGVDEGKRLVAVDITQAAGDSDDNLQLAVLLGAGRRRVRVPKNSSGPPMSNHLSDTGFLLPARECGGGLSFEVPESAILVAVMTQAEVLGPNIVIADLTSE